MAFLPLILVLAAFVGWHFMIPVLRVRGIAWLGKTGYHTAFGLVSLGLFIWAIRLLLQGPEVMMWTPPIWARHLSFTLMPMALILLVAGFWHPNPFSMGRKAGFDPENPGIVKLIRHPVLWAVVLWAMAHIIANGDVGSVIFFGTALGLTLFGFWRNRGPLPPLGALKIGRLAAPVGLALALSLGIAFLHGPLFGVTLLP